MATETSPPDGILLRPVPRVLVLAYHFPPVGGAGVQRSAKFALYLPRHGWEVVVVTGPLTSIGDAHLKDTTLLDELPADLEILRVPGPEPAPRSAWVSRAERVLRLQSSWRKWWVTGATQVGRTTKAIDVLFASMSPFESCAPAATLARAHNVPWVADLRDPWALDEMQVYVTGMHRRLELRHMRRSLSTAAAIVMNTEEAALQLGHVFPELSGRTHVIPNGFDADDFAEPVEDPQDGVFRIVHTGDLHTALGLRHGSTEFFRRTLGGTLNDVDILARSHVFLLEALERLCRRRPELRGVIEIHFAGELDAADSDALQGAEVVLHGYLTHDDAVRLMRSADLLFLPMHGLPAHRRARIVPGKTYEYLASRRPILAAVPEGDARDLLRRAGSALLTLPADVGSLTQAIESQIDRKRAGIPPPEPEADVLAPYERRILTARLAEVLHAVHNAGKPPRAVASRS